MQYKGFFINIAKSQNSISESGEMIYQIEHVEISIQKKKIPLRYDFQLYYRITKNN